MHSNCSVIILAAGNGSRFKTSTPKILCKVGRLSLLEHIIRGVKTFSPKKIVVVTKPDFEIRSLKFSEGINSAFQKEQKGTADAVRCGLSLINEDENNNSDCENNSKNYDDWVYILYADIPLISSETLRKMYEVAHFCEKTSVVVLAMDSNGAKNLGKLESAEELSNNYNHQNHNHQSGIKLGIESETGTIKRIVEAKDANGKENNLLPLCNCGLLVRKSLLNNLIKEIKSSPATGEFYITEIVRLAYEKGFVCRYYKGDKRELCGANTLNELSLLERNFQDIMREKFMNSGVQLIAPETVFFSYDTEIEPNVIVNPYVIFYEGVRIESGAVIGPFCVIEGAKIETAQIGPFSRVRPDSEIHNGARIGNFVEIKRSIISENTKVNHLSYIGDSFVGKNTNIGAGTITCNYDGVNKYHTEIGENVFIGSNSAIVAPVKINNRVTVGAGSVITDDVPENSLAIARGKQRNIENWKRKERKKITIENNKEQ